ncbi:MAG: A/G-specific adenine glycosylase [Clostridia bacterium]|nr:A/G-specific adenine glycosylase [Clostridia bacterium]
MTDMADLLLAWYDAEKRVMPWRGIHDPYRTWVSEIMLQQTRVDTVRDYYTRFITAFPDVFALAEADEADVLKMWEGLGYYSRARNLQEGARQVAERFGGILPSDPSVLASIRGIGPYTAGAIAAIAYDVPAAAVDGNVIRVISRFSGIREDPTVPSVRALIEKTVLALMNRKRPGDFDQALMDLGATVCVPGTPDCDRCPLRDLCNAYAAGDAQDLPLLPAKAPPRVKPYDVCVVLSGSRVLLRQRTEKLLNGMYVFWMREGHSDIRKLRDVLAGQFAAVPLSVDCRESAKHVFTHLVWDMNLYLVTLPPDLSAPAGYLFVNKDELDRYPVPVAMKAARRLL